MAKVTSIVHLDGTIDELIFYTLNGQSLVRRKPTNMKSVFANAPGFEKQRAMSKLFTASNAMATAVYRMAKGSEVALDYRQHSKLVKVITKRFNQADVDLKDLHFAYLRGVLAGIRLDKVREGMPVSFSWRGSELEISSGVVGERELLVKLYKGRLVCPKWNRGKYVCELDMEDVGLMEVSISSGEVLRLGMELGDDEVLVGVVGEFVVVV